MSEESKSLLLFMAVLTFGVLLITVVWALAANLLEPSSDKMYRIQL